ncbi:MAG: hypothetical protein M3N59_02265 [bacterium]|nr:hypothetical protein [bacterium]
MQFCFAVTLLLNLSGQLLARLFGSADRKAKWRSAALDARAAGGRRGLARYRMRRTFRRPTIVTMIFVPFTIAGNVAMAMLDEMDDEPGRGWATHGQGTGGIKFVPGR